MCPIILRLAGKGFAFFFCLFVVVASAIALSLRPSTAAAIVMSHDQKLLDAQIAIEMPEGQSTTMHMEGNEEDEADRQRRSALSRCCQHATQCSQCIGTIDDVMHMLLSPRASLRALTLLLCSDLLCSAAAAAACCSDSVSVTCSAPVNIAVIKYCQSTHQ